MKLGSRKCHPDSMQRQKVKVGLEESEQAELAVSHKTEEDLSRWKRNKEDFSGRVSSRNKDQDMGKIYIEFCYRCLD